VIMSNFLHKSTVLIPFAALAALAFLLICAPLRAAAASSAGSSPEARAAALQDFYRGLTSLTFDFSQMTFSGGRERTGKGNAVFYKGPAPAAKTGQDHGRGKWIGIMRWNYTEPDNQVIINDGETLSIYTAKDKQLIRTPAGELESDITYAFFAGARALLDDFEAGEASGDPLHPAAGDLRTLLLVPRQPHNQIKTIQVWFDAASIIRHFRIEDHFGATTDLRFDNIEYNSLPPYDPKQVEMIISLQVPPDTEIITQ